MSKNETFAACVIVLFLSAGLFFALPIIQPLEITRALAIGFMALAAAIAFCRADTLQISAIYITPIPATLLLFTLWIATTIIWSSDQMISFIVLMTFMMLPLGFIAASSLPRTPIFSKPVFKNMDTPLLVYLIIGIPAGLLALWAYAQYYAFPELLEQGQIAKPFANFNLYAAFLSLGFFSGLGMSLHTKCKIVRLSAALLCALCVGAIIMIGSRGALLFLIIAALIALFTLAPLAKKRRLDLTLIITFAAATIAALTWLPTPHNEITLDGAQRIAAAIGGDTSSLDARLYIWSSTIDMIKQAPFLGTGFGTFYLHYTEFRSPEDIHSSGLMAHADPLQFWAESGLPALMLFYAFIALCLWRMVKFLIETPRHAPERAMPVALFCGLGAMVVHAHISFPFYSAPMLCAAGIMMGLWYQMSAITSSAQKRTVALPANARIIIGVFIALCLIYGTFTMFASQYYGRMARSVPADGTIEQYIDFVNKADKRSHGMNAQAYIYAANIPLMELESSRASMNAVQIKTLMDQAQHLLDQSEKRNTRLSDLYLNKARLARLQNNQRAAFDAYRTGLKHNPMHGPMRLAYVQALIEAGQKQQALLVAEDGLKWFRVFHPQATFYTLAITLAGEMNRPDIAEKAQTQKQRLFPKAP